MADTSTLERDIYHAKHESAMANDVLVEGTSLEHAHNEKRAHMFAIDSTTGSKIFRYIRTPHGERAYSEFFAYLDGLPESKRIFYEMTTQYDDVICYFDVDAGAQEDTTAFLFKVLNLLVKFLNLHCSVDATLSQFLVSQSHGVGKCSFHVLAPFIIKGDQIVAFRSALKVFLAGHQGSEAAKAIDTAVYRDGMSQFRFLFNSKRGKNRFFVPFHHDRLKSWPKTRLEQFLASLLAHDVRNRGVLFPETAPFLSVQEQEQRTGKTGASTTKKTGVYTKAELSGDDLVRVKAAEKALKKVNIHNSELRPGYLCRDSLEMYLLTTGSWKCPHGVDHDNNNAHLCVKLYEDDRIDVIFRCSFTYQSCLAACRARGQTYSQETPIAQYRLVDGEIKEKEEEVKEEAPKEPAKAKEAKPGPPKKKKYTGSYAQLFLNPADIREVIGLLSDAGITLSHTHKQIIASTCALLNGKTVLFSRDLPTTKHTITFANGWIRFACKCSKNPRGACGTCRFDSFNRRDRSKAVAYIKGRA